MPNFEKPTPVEPQSETEQEKRARLISHYLDRIVENNESLAEDEELEIKEYFGKMSTKDKADLLYNRLMAYTVDQQIAKENDNEPSDDEQEEVDPYLVSEIKVLMNDLETKELFSQTYAEARIDAKDFRVSDIGKLWQETTEDIIQKQERYQELERQVNLGKISSRGRITSAGSRMAISVDNLESLRNRKEGLESLDGFSKTQEHTDIVAGFQYKNLSEYKKQLDRGFVWLPSRKEIHKETINALLNHRRPLLIGEAGTGKSEQADAAAIELTGYEPTKIECESTSGETQFIKDKAIASENEGGQSYDEYGALMQAFTGYENSKQNQPTIDTGRIVRLDEAGRLGTKAYSILKRAHQVQKKTGADFYGKPVLAGAGVIGTTNPVGQRYPDRSNSDPAARREWSEIKVDYPEMSVDQPELYEFALAALFDDDNHIRANKAELAPAYEKAEIPEAERKILEDGSIVVAKDEIVEDMSDLRHGALWRFCGAIKSVQDSFVYGNSDVEQYPDSLLRIKEDADGNFEATDDGSGDILTLSSSTVTLGELASWIGGFNDRMQKQDSNFRVDTLSEWLDFKIKTYLKQSDKEDRGKLEALFKKFHFLEDNAPNPRESKPLTPKEIGYLSPRVPRPVYLEKPQHQEDEAEDSVEEKGTVEVVDDKTNQVRLKTGEAVLLKVSDFNGESEIGEPLELAVGQKLIMEDGTELLFAGVVEDDSSEQNGKLVCRLASDYGLCQVITPEEADVGLLLAGDDLFDNQLDAIVATIDMTDK